ncbi:hypothetical protein H6U92_002806 [Listeria monocytogenes]|nr:hypothetical protein [Listeria monocytogenes]
MICQKKLSDKTLRSLLKNSRTDLIKGWTGKNGKIFDAALVLNDGSLNFEFSHI